MSIKLGITGGIGSGKSVVSRLLQLMGVPIYLSDDRAKELTQSDPEIKRKLISLIGEHLYNDQALDKKILSSYLFANAKHTTQVNQIIHPQVKKDFQRWVSQHHLFPIIAIESAILIESGFSSDVDIVVMVFAGQELRLRRAMERDSAPAELILKRIQSQMNDEEKRTLAHFTIFNNEDSLLIPQVSALLKQLKQDYIS